MRRQTRRPDSHLSVRLSDELISAIDAEGERMETERPGVRLTRTDAVRVLLLEALAARGRLHAMRGAPSRLTTKRGQHHELG